MLMEVMSGSTETIGVSVKMLGSTIIERMLTRATEPMIRVMTRYTGRSMTAESSFKNECRFLTGDGKAILFQHHYHSNIN